MRLEDKLWLIGCSRKLETMPPAEDSVLTLIDLFAIPALPPGLISFLPFLGIILVFYVMLIRPNQKKQKQWQEMLAGLRPGDRITTTGGIRGSIL